MSRIVSRADLVRRYPAAVLEDFVPTHRVVLLDTRTNCVLCEDVVRLGPADDRGVRFAETPEGRAVYAVIPGGKWQCLDQHGHVQEEAILYRQDYVRPADRDGFVYFVQAGHEGPIKIGWSQDVPRRLGELQVANAARLFLIAAVPGKRSDEAATHERFAHLRLGAEWFRDDPEIHEYLRVRGDPPIRDP
jgi:hypothetical protein